MHIIWLTPEFPSNKDNTKGVYIFRTVAELSKYYQITIVSLYPAAPPIFEMLRYPKDWMRIYNDWKKNYTEIDNPNSQYSALKIIYLRYFRLPRSYFHNIEGWFAYFQLKKQLPQLVKKDSILHANWIFPAGTLASIISKKFKIPFLISLMGSDINRLVEGTVFWKSAKKLLLNANKVTAVTNELFEACTKKNINIKPDNKIQIDNIYESEIFKIFDKNEIRNEISINRSEKIIFFAGGLVPVKNVDVLICAFENICKKLTHIKLIIAGSGSEEGLLKRLVQTKNLNDKIKFVGNLNTGNLVKYYNAADVFCLPSKNEGLPNVIVESFFCGTPVVASRVGGIPTIVQNELNGFLAEPNSVDDLTLKLEKSILINWNREEIRNSISHLMPEKVLIKYKILYESIIGI
ncbi:MAG: glycosyltransferase [Ignavibacteriae bacterium]|nr:glycosyltransferase [Ignavibacteriota bacterium]